MRALLPRELLTIRRRGEEVQPVLAPVDDAHLALSRDLVDVFDAHVGRPRAELMAHLAEHELRVGTRFKLVRGLATLLERRCRFEERAPLDPRVARRFAFEESARLPAGAATSPEARERALSAAAMRLGATPADVARALDADSEDALVLAAFDAPDARALLERYNVGLVQALLFDAVRVELTIERAFRPFLGLVKLHGLMHVVEQAEAGAHRIVLDGPLSLFQDTRRYGTGVAKTIPALARCGRWTLDALLRLREDGSERRFHLTSDELPLRALREPSDEDAPAAYDSVVERRFAEAWTSLRSPWRIVREPAAIQVQGGELFIPDFGFAWRDGPVRAYLEIVGFWTPEYLARKMTKVRKLPPDVALLLAVDATLGVGENAVAELDGANAFPYKGDVAVVPVVQWLRAFETEMLDDEVARVLAAPLPDAPVVRVPEWARALGVTATAVERALPKLDTGARVRLGDALVTPDALDALAANLSEGMPLPAAEEAARAIGLSDTSSLLAHLGYTAAWQGLDPTAATLRKKK